MPAQQSKTPLFASASVTSPFAELVLHIIYYSMGTRKILAIFEKNFFLSLIKGYRLG
ncbi:hypothetical protein HMPREF1985_00366 [Mitsuokella sp. oral taxon 131 str. W9106]|nr:hypothetical protein HMPREF1985_00366 [Mitsuokella sp. oral taxon 131 str. W9106]